MLVAGHGPAEDQRQFRVQGRVQGVGFRWWTRSLAQRLSLSGTVRNLSDGTVEVRARGSAAAMEQLREALHHGPDGARVDAVHEEDAHDVPADRFEIVR